MLDTSSHLCGWHECENNFPSNAGEVEKSLGKSHLVNNKVVLINTWSELHGVLHLGRERLFLGLHEIVHQLSMIILFLLCVFILDNCDSAHVLF